MGFLFCPHEKRKGEYMEAVDRWTVKKALQKQHVHGYELAEHLGICESALSKRLRNPTADQVKEMLAAINTITGKRG